MAAIALYHIGHSHRGTRRCQSRSIPSANRIVALESSNACMWGHVHRHMVVRVVNLLCALQERAACDPHCGLRYASVCCARAGL